MSSLGCKGFQEIRAVRTGYKGLHEEILDNKRFQGVTRGYKRLQVFTTGYRGVLRA